MSRPSSAASRAASWTEVVTTSRACAYSTTCKTPSDRVITSGKTRANSTNACAAQGRVRCNIGSPVADLGARCRGSRKRVGDFAEDARELSAEHRQRPGRGDHHQSAHKRVLHGRLPAPAAAETLRAWL